MARRSTALAAVALLVLIGACSSDPASTSAPATAVTTTAATTTTTTTTAATSAATALDPVGIWLGNLLPGVRIQFRFQRSADGTLGGVMDSLDEGAMGVPVTEIVEGEDGSVEATIAAIPATVVLTPSGVDAYDCSFRAAGEQYAFTLERQAAAIALDRPQHPEPPYPYRVEEVTIRQDRDGFTLAGTLTLPEGAGPFPGVVLVTGSGPQDRDETLMGHKPFLVIADHLTRAGIAVLRADDRGVGGSGGDPVGATSLDLAADAAAVLAYLRGRPEVDPGAVGIVGHSEGGLIGPIVADADPGAVAWLVLLAGPGADGITLLAEQQRLLMAAEGAPPEVVDWWTGVMGDLMQIAVSDLDGVTARTEMRLTISDALETLPEGSEGDASVLDLFGVADEYTDPWMRWFLAHDPAPTLERLDLPVLALLGSLDLQVAPSVNEAPLRAALDGPDQEVIVLPGLNHLFQHATTGAVSEYLRISETISPEVLDLVAGWILDRSR